MLFFVSFKRNDVNLLSLFNIFGSTTRQDSIRVKRRPCLDQLWFSIFQYLPVLVFQFELDSKVQPIHAHLSVDDCVLVQQLETLPKVVIQSERLQSVHCRVFGKCKVLELVSTEKEKEC